MYCLISNKINKYINRDIGKNKFSSLAATLLCFSLLNIGLPSIAESIEYSGNVSTNGCAIATGNGSSASASIKLRFNVNKYVVVGIYNSSGVITNPIFSSPSDDFPNGTTFNADHTVLMKSESSLASKFEIDGVTNAEDEKIIVESLYQQHDVLSDDICIKGAIYSNAPTSGDLIISTDKNSLTLAGGQGSAPVYNFRAIAGVPGIVSAKSQTPCTMPLGIGNKRNSKGYARFAVVGDLDESSVDCTTDGNWEGTVTVVVSGL